MVGGHVFCKSKKLVLKQNACCEKSLNIRSLNNTFILILISGNGRHYLAATTPTLRLPTEPCSSHWTFLCCLLIKRLKKAFLSWHKQFFLTFEQHSFPWFTFSYCVKCFIPKSFFSVCFSHCISCSNCVISTLHMDMPMFSLSRVIGFGRFP